MKIKNLVMAFLLLAVVSCKKDNGNAPDLKIGVDLGLSVKWASCNVGASSPERYGSLFAWGETNTNSDCSWDTYKWCNGTYNSQTKYCTTSSYGIVDKKTTLEPEDDAAHVNWGGEWRMPTNAEWDELKTQCTWLWTQQNGVYGYEVTGKNGNSIFLPAAGANKEGMILWVGHEGNYWSSITNGDNMAHCLRFDSEEVRMGEQYRPYGYSVRPVCSREECEIK